MNKEEFLEKLKRRLSILKDSEIEDIITEYGGYIDEKVKKGKSEEEAIKEFGDFDEFVKEILSAYKIDEEKSKSKNVVMDFFDELGSNLDALIKDLSSKGFNEIIKFVIEIILILILIGLFKIPVELLIRLATNIFVGFPHPVQEIFEVMWRVIFELSYLIIAVIFFVKIFKERYLKNIRNNQDVDEEEVTVEEKKTTKKDNVKETKKEVVKEIKVENTPKENNDSVSSLLTKIVIAFVKVMIAFILIPFIFVGIGTVIVFSLGISFFVAGAHYFGILICLFAIMMFTFICIELMFNFIFNRKTSGTRIFISVISTVIILGAGIGITAVELANSSYIDDVPSSYKSEVITKEYSIEEIENIYPWFEIEYVNEEELKDKIRIEVTYYDEFTNPKIVDANGDIHIDFNRGTRISGKKIYKLVMGDLKKKELHNYTDLFNPQITIYGTKENIKKLNEKIEREELNTLYDELDRTRDERDEWREKYYDLKDDNYIPIED